MTAADNKDQKLPQGFTPPHVLSGMPPETPILIGFSGGADSCALLDILHTYSGIHGTKLYAAHIHHGIRGDEADRDAEFCRLTAERYGIEFFFEKFDVPAISRQTGESLEGCGRRVRYEYFSKLMRERGIPLLALAHHADDNLETVIYNLLRGSGSNGMCGIPPVRKTDDVPGGLLIRPLIYASKAQILEYCGDRKLGFVTDSTNAEDDCVRNLIRHRIVPILEEIRPDPQASCSRMTSALAEDCRALDRIAEDEFSECGEEIPLHILRTRPAAIAKRMILLLCRENRVGTLTAVQLNAVLAECISKESSEIRLSADARAVISRGTLKIRPDEDIFSEDYSIGLRPGVNLLPGGVALCVGQCKVPDGYVSVTSALLDPRGGLTAHTRRADDRINTMGMTKTLKKLYNERGVPVGLRRVLPVVCDGDGVLLIPGCAVRTGAEGITPVTTLFSNELYKKFDHITERKNYVDK